MNKSACVFCHKIKTGKGIRYEHGFEHQVVSFEPLNPVAPGHRLFVPTAHIERQTRRIEAIGTAMALAHRYGQQQGVDFNLIQSNGAAATQTVDHVHVHYVPRNSTDGLMLPWSPGHDNRKFEWR